MLKLAEKKKASLVTLGNATLGNTTLGTTTLGNLAEQQRTGRGPRPE